MKLYLTGRPGERELAMERQDVLDAMTEGFGYVSLAGFPSPMPLSVVSRSEVKVKMWTGSHLSTPFSRIVDMHRVVA